MSQEDVIRLGAAAILPEVREGWLRSLGAVTVHGTPLRNPTVRFLPWFDTYEGDVFRAFRYLGVERRGDETVIRLTAVSDPDVLFRERRDSSGDVCLRAQGWDETPLEAEFRIVVAPTATEFDGHRFEGVRYGFEYESPSTAIHRLADRQTWEVGGDLRDVTLVCRNWLTPPRMRVAKETSYSTVGLDTWAGLLPGNLWARWSLLPAFDMQYGKAGVLLAWFDRVSLIRAVIESNAGEDAIRCVDLHYFEQGKTVRTNPKTVVWCPDILDDTDALNLWTRVYDREHEKACAQFGIHRQAPPPIVFGDFVWKDVHFDTTYEKVMATAAEFGADYVYIAPIWENGETFRRELAERFPPAQVKGLTVDKFLHEHMCCSYDWEVGRVNGGEEGLRALCERAAAQGIKIISWMAMHLSPRATRGQDPTLATGGNGAFAAKESGRHPDTGYPANSWPLNLNGPAWEWTRERMLDVCRRTGLAGFAWDSFSNLGWWQVDYSTGTMRPQFDRMAQMFADLVNAGLYIQPEGIVSFSTASCCGLHGGNVYAGDRMGYAYNTVIAMRYPDETAGHLRPAVSVSKDHASEILCGREPFELLFQAMAHKWVPELAFHLAPRAEWDAEAERRIKDLLASYKAVRGDMVRRTVLKENAGVLWEGEHGRQVFYCFRDQRRQGPWQDARTGAAADGDRLQACRVYVQPRSWNESGETEKKT